MTKQQAASLLSMLPDSVSEGILQRAKDKQQDLPTTVMQLLEQGLLAETHAMTDLNEFVGSWEDDPAFDEAMRAFEEVNSD